MRACIHMAFKLNFMNNINMLFMLHCATVSFRLREDRKIVRHREHIRFAQCKLRDAIQKKGRHKPPLVYWLCSNSKSEGWDN